MKANLVLITPVLIIRNPIPPSCSSNKQNFERLSLLIHKQNKFWHITLMLLVMLYYANMVITNQVVAVIGGLYYEDNN